MGRRVGGMVPTEQLVMGELKAGVQSLDLLLAVPQSTRWLWKWPQCQLPVRSSPTLSEPTSPNSPGLALGLRAGIPSLSVALTHSSSEGPSFQPEAPPSRPPLDQALTGTWSLCSPDMRGLYGNLMPSGRRCPFLSIVCQNLAYPEAAASTHPGRTGRSRMDGGSATGRQGPSWCPPR